MEKTLSQVYTNNSLVLKPRHIV